MGSDDKPGFRVLQVSNISTHATKDQVYQLFQCLGRINELKLYPSDINVSSSTTQKFAYIRYDDTKSVELGQHLTNMVLIDRALVCVPSIDNVIPDENTALSMGGPPLPGQRVLPPHVVNKVQEIDGSQMLLTVDPTLDQLGLPQYPPLPADTEPSKVEEIRRTVYVGNLPKGVDGQAVLDFFNMTIGEVMYVRMTTGPDTLPCAYAFVEFSSQVSVPIALQNNTQIDFEGRYLRIVHSRVAIIKPQRKTADQALEEVEEAIKKKDAGISYLTARSRSRSVSRSAPSRDRAVDRDRDRDRRTSRPRSPRRRSRTRSPRRRSRSRERERRRSRSPRRRSRSRDRDRESRRRRSRSRSKERRRSRSRDRKDRDVRDRSRDRKRDKEKEKEKEKKERKRSRSRTPKKDKKRDRDRSTEKSSKKEKEKRDKDKEREKKKEKEKKKGKEKEKDKDHSDSDLDEAAIRERLLEKVALRKEEEDEEVPTKIANQRKRKHSGSDSD